MSDKIYIWFVVGLAVVWMLGSIILFLNGHPWIGLFWFGFFGLGLHSVASSYPEYKKKFGQYD